MINLRFASYEVEVFFMLQHRASVTALVTAYVRAYHASVPELKGLFDDYVAPQLFTTEELEQFGGHLAGTMQTPTRAVTLGRSRFCEERILEAGLPQLVQVGAGYDTFPQRHPGRTRVFEVDHPATQADKRQRLARAGYDEAGATYVAVDLAATSLEEALAGSGFDPARPAFFAWLGVTYYLERSAVDATFAAIARLAAPGSRLVFDYLEPAALGPQADPAIVQVQAILRQLGEPFITGLEVGFPLVEDLGPAEIQARYTLPGYQAAPHFRFAHAAL
jgi:methyltransferase (TIGR00027 family)